MDVVFKEYGITVEFIEDFKQFEKVCLTNVTLSNINKPDRDKYLKKYHNETKKLLKPKKSGNNIRVSEKSKEDKSDKDL